MNKLAFEFTGTDSGWIDLFFKYKYMTLEYTFSAVDTKPEELISWLENIYNDKYDEFVCSTEDFKWYLDYDGNNLTISDNSNIEGANKNSRKTARMQIPITKRDVCTLFYKSFRVFSSSMRYCRFRWDEITFKDYLLEKFGTLDTALTAAVKGSLADFYKLCLEQIPKPELGLGFKLFDEFESGFAEKLSDTFDQANNDKKKEIIEQYYSDTSGFDKSCKNLRDVKSTVLEQLCERSLFIPTGGGV